MPLVEEIPPTIGLQKREYDDVHKDAAMTLRDEEINMIRIRVNSFFVEDSNADKDIN